MVWAILMFLGVPLWICVLGITVTVLRNRGLRKRPGDIPARVRLPGKTRWTRGHGIWVSDVFAWRGSPAAWKEKLVQVSGVTLRSPSEEEQHKLHRLGEGVQIATLSSVGRRAPGGGRRSRGFHRARGALRSRRGPGAPCARSTRARSRACQQLKGVGDVVDDHRTKNEAQDGTGSPQAIRGHGYSRPPLLRNGGFRRHREDAAGARLHGGRDPRRPRGATRRSIPRSSRASSGWTCARSTAGASG